MSLQGLVTVVCDQCGEQSEPALNVVAARTMSTSNGWAIVRDAVRAFDYCPRHAGRPTPPPLVPTTTHVDVELTPNLWVCPECGQGKCGNCNGWAWNFDADEKTQCQCPEVHP